MPTFLMIFRHSPENCPMFNEKTRKVLIEVTGKYEELLKKHGIKEAGSWSVPTEHLGFTVYEASSVEALQNFGMEPEILAMSAYETVEIKIAITAEEAAKMLQQAR